MNSNYSFLIQKLDAFIKRFYLNELLRGSIYFLAILLVSTLFFTTLEYFGNFGTTPRLLIFWVYLLGNIGAFAVLVAKPFASWAKLGKQISHKQAAQIIGVHFIEIKDKLLNTLELQESDFGSKSLIEASIEQKISELKPVPFNMAINFKKNRKYLKYAAIPLLIILLLMIQVPDVILKSSARIISYNEEFLPEAPFDFELDNEKLEVLAHQDFEFKLKIRGEVLPALVRINVGGNTYRMTKIAPNEFTYNLRNVENNLDFNFEASGFNSNTFELKVLPKPFLKSFYVELEYPKYTGKKNEAFSNIGDFTIPEGTIAKWKYQTENTENLRFNWNGKLQKSERISKNTFRFTKQVFNNSKYYVQSINEFVPVNDSMGYGVQVVKDAYPTVQVNMVSDTSSLKSYFFSGELTDDYGLSALTFNYRFTKSEKENKLKDGYKSQSIGVSTNSIQSFFHHWDLRQIGYEAGDELEFYFQVWDNDAVNGRKSSKSKRMTVKAPSKNEVKALVAETSSTIKTDMAKALDEAKKVQEELKDIQNKLINKDKLEWEDKKAISKLLERQKSLQSKVDNLNKDYKEMMKKQDEFKELDENLRKKHEQLMKLFDELMDEEMKKMFDELQKMLDENKENIKDELEDMELNNDELEKELDAALEHFKQLEVEQKLKDAIEKLDELAKKQDELAKETENGEKPDEELAKEQDEIKKEFEELEKELEKLNELKTDNVEPLTSVAETTLKLRPDEVKSKDIREQIIKNS
ncbi:MAG: hypothetical protein ACPGLV_10365, partial [Bacteroidia bacterium]